MNTDHEDDRWKAELDRLRQENAQLTKKHENPPMHIDHITDEWIDAGQYSAQDVIDLRDEVRRLRSEGGNLDEQNKEYKATFDLHWKANQRAIKRWQEETGRELTWPDHADLVIWILEKLAQSEAQKESWKILAERSNERADKLLSSHREAMEMLRTAPRFYVNEEWNAIRREPLETVHDGHASLRKTRIDADDELVAVIRVDEFNKLLKDHE